MGNGGGDNEWRAQAIKLERTRQIIRMLIKQQFYTSPAAGKSGPVPAWLSAFNLNHRLQGHLGLPRPTRTVGAGPPTAPEFATPCLVGYVQAATNSPGINIYGLARAKRRRSRCLMRHGKIVRGWRERGRLRG